MSSLEGKVALITGAGRHKGLGQAMARAIAKTLKIMMNNVFKKAS